MTKKTAKTDTWPSARPAVSIALNGLALRVAGGDEVDVEPLIRLLHDAIAPRQ